MPRVEQQRDLPFPADDLFDMVADVGAYPDFLPWCVATRIREPDAQGFLADVLIGFRMVRERFTSRITLADDKRSLQVSLVRGPFRHLETLWRFESLPEGQGTRVSVDVDFLFSTPLLQRLIEPLFEEAQRRMIAAFEARAYALFTPLNAQAKLQA